MARILLTGGLGYIGLHTGFQLVEAGHEIVIIDNCANSSERVLERYEKKFGSRPKFFKGDVRDAEFLRQVFSDAPIDAVIHFAALKAVDESFTKRDEYFDVNVGGTQALCEAMEEFGVRRLVYSSSATVYGMPESNPIPETAPLRSTNPYGETKIAAEKLLQEFAAQHGGWAIVILRYFNPAGAHNSALIGEAPTKAANIAAAILEVLRGRRDILQINGTDYDTPDGTCVRDFIHVMDLASAHEAALRAAMVRGSGVQIYNVGTGRGHSVNQIVAAFSRAAHREIPTHIGPRRAGDVAVAVADPSKIERELGWRATHSLDDIAESAVTWITAHPNGFEN